MANIGEIKARLVMDSSDFNRKANEARDSMGNLSKSAHRTSREIRSIQAASLAVGTAVVAGIGASVAVAANFEKAMARVGAISGATGEDFDRLEAKAKELGETTQYSSSQAAEGMQFLAMA